MKSELLKRAGAVIVAGYREAQPPAQLIEAIADGELAGVILFSRNLGDFDRIAETNARLASAAPSLPLLIAIDQEGGRVQRIRDPLCPWPPMRELGEIGDLALTERVGRAIGAELFALGFNLDFAPVLDVVQSDVNTVIGDRSFSSSAKDVSDHGLALAQGLLKAGVLSCGKHFPGHGGEVADSHHVLPVENRDEATLRGLDLIPFVQAAAKVPALMSAHVRYPALDPEHPGTFSARICTELLRDELGFEGVLFSDDMEMAAVADNYQGGEAAVAAIEAGVDCLLICHDRQRQLAAHKALIARAEQDERFAQRLEQAASRVDSLRRRSAEIRPNRTEQLEQLDPLEVFSEFA